MKDYITPIEHYAMALVLAAVEEGHRRVNVLPGLALNGRIVTLPAPVTAASRQLSYLGHALEEMVPQSQSSPYFRDYKTVPPNTNEKLLALLQNVGIIACDRGTAKVIKTYQKCVQTLEMVVSAANERDDRDRRWGRDPWGHPRPKW
jgi:hypothetical protein